MNSILKKLTDGASDAGALARSIASAGLRSVNEVLCGTKIFGALTVSTAADLEYDETHYVLVPLLGKSREYAIYTKRILPPDTGATNSLPKLRVFHLPDESGQDLLEQELIKQCVDKRMDRSAGSSQIADKLEEVADRIDHETNRISGGLMMIGGAVALVNPIVGVGIVAKGLLPSIGAKASKAGAEYVGGKLRHWRKSSEVSKLQKDATHEIGRLKPKIYTNPIIRSLDAIATNPETDFDPAFDERNWIDGFESPHYYTITQEAISEVYRELLDSTAMSSYQKEHIAWIKSFLEASAT